MFPLGLGDVLFKAIRLAQQSRASEIDIHALLAAIDAPELEAPSFPALPPDIRGDECCGFYANSDWIPLSTDAQKALAPFAETDAVDTTTLRKALLTAKQ
jgi:hypothetical protein